MIPARAPIQRPATAQLLVVEAFGNVRHCARAALPNILRAGDLVIANDAATLPASLSGHHSQTGLPVEVRLAGRDSLSPEKVKHFSAVIFGDGDYRTRTEDRPKPPTLNPGDRLRLGPLAATVVGLLNHPRFISLEFTGSPRQIWEGIARHGRPIQYAHVPPPLAVWDTWTPIAGPPVAFEPPSASFMLAWSVLDTMSARGIGFGTITHAAGISSTGDPELDALLPLDEPYRIPQSTAQLIEQTRGRGGRIVAIGTTVVRTLEHAAVMHGAVRAGEGLATQRIGAGYQLRVVDAILSGTHERGSSHYELLRAFADDRTLRQMDDELNSRNYLAHEFGDSIFLEKEDRRCSQAA